MILDVLSHSWHELKGIVGFIAVVGGLFFWFGGDVIFLGFLNKRKDSASCKSSDEVANPPCPNPHKSAASSTPSLPKIEEQS